MQAPPSPADAMPNRPKPDMLTKQLLGKEEES
jgi:hypothetical protein